MANRCTFTCSMECLILSITFHFHCSLWLMDLKVLLGSKSHSLSTLHMHVIYINIIIEAYCSVPGKHPWVLKHKTINFWLAIIDIICSLISRPIPVFQCYHKMSNYSTKKIIQNFIWCSIRTFKKYLRYQFSYLWLYFVL